MASGPISGLGSSFLLGKYDLTSFLHSVKPGNPIEKNNTSVFGPNKSSVPGQSSGMFSIDGWFDPAVGAYSEALSAYMGTLPVPATLGYPVAVGDFACFVNGWVSAKDITSDIKQAVALSSAVEGQEGMDYGVYLHLPSITETATANGTSVDNLALSANGWGANLHVFSTTGGAPSTVIKIQHSTDNSTWVDLVTFTTVTAGTYEHKSGAGTVNRYVRAVWTLGGSTTNIKFAVAFGRR
jgi:hypothetical protein